MLFICYFYFKNSLQSKNTRRRKQIQYEIERHQGSALKGASSKNNKYCKNIFKNDKSELLTNDLKAAIDFTVSDVIFSELI